MIVAISYGMPLELAKDWVQANQLEGSMSNIERQILQGVRTPGAQEQGQVEAIWALSWVLSITDDLSAENECSDDLVKRVPDLRSAESLASWQSRKNPSLRDADEVMTELDLHYCMTWGLAEANLRRHLPPGNIEQFAMWQRRRALEYTLARYDEPEDDWDDIDLST